MTTTDGENSQPVPAERVAHALRRIRANCYRIEVCAEGTCVSLVMQASPAGRRNAAMHVVSLLGDHGLHLVAADPVEELTRPGCALLVRATVP
jgi:hypothetical protein